MKPTVTVRYCLGSTNYGAGAVRYLELNARMRRRCPAHDRSSMLHAQHWRIRALYYQVSRIQPHSANSTRARRQHGLVGIHINRQVSIRTDARAEIALLATAEPFIPMAYGDIHACTRFARPDD